MRKPLSAIVKYSRIVFLFVSVYYSEHIICNGFNKFSLILYILLLVITISLLVSGWIKKTIGFPTRKSVKSIIDGKGDSLYSIILTFTVLIYMEWIYNSLYPVDIVTLQSNWISGIPIIFALILSFCLLPRINPKNRYTMFSGISFKRDINESMELLLKPVRSNEFIIDKLILIPSTQMCEYHNNLYKVVCDSCKNLGVEVIILPGVDYDDFVQCVDSFRKAILQNEDNSHDSLLYITPGTSIVSASLTTFALTNNRKCIYLKQDGTNVLSMFSLKLNDMEPDTME